MIENIPNGWRVEKFREVFDFEKKSKIKASEGLHNGEYPFYTSSKILKKYINENNFDITEALIFGTGGLASIHYTTGKFSTSTDCFIVKTKINDIETKYIYNYLLGNIYILEYGFKGAGLKHISKKYIEDIDIPFPPLLQQKKIVKVLDISSQLIEKQKELIAEYDLFLKSKFIEMFGDPIKNPMEWEVVKIQDITTFLTSGSRGWAKYYSDEGEVFIRIQNVKNGNITFTEKQYINAPFTQEAKRTKVKENDLLLSITADLGRTGVVSKSLEDEGAYISQHLALLRLKESFSAIYVSAFIETISGKLQFEKLNQGGTKAGLNFNAINSFKLFNPPIELQNKFASIVEKIETIKNQETQKLEHLETLHKSLMDKSFKGEIV